MSYVVLTSREREELCELFFQLRRVAYDNPLAREEVMTALRCLKAVHSNAIEDKSVDRVFLQLLMHRAGVPDKSRISRHYSNAASELQGQEEMLRLLEHHASDRVELSISLLLEIHSKVFSQSCPEMAGRFRSHEVRISDMVHRPCHHTQIEQLLYQRFADINSRLFAIESVTPGNFADILRLSAEAHYLIASVHPFNDGNGRIARAVGDYVMLTHGYFYDVIMTDYRDIYLDSLTACSPANVEPLFYFLEYSYLETLRRISGFFKLIGR